MPPTCKQKRRTLTRPGGEGLGRKLTGILAVESLIYQGRKPKSEGVRKVRDTTFSLRKKEYIREYKKI
jgi:hypothetical protein